VQQKKRRRVFRAGLSVENGEPINLCRAIHRRILHRTFLSGGWSEQLKRECQENYNFNAGGQQESLQLRVLCLGLLQDGDVGVGIFPEGEEVLVVLARTFLVAAKDSGSAQL